MTFRLHQPYPPDGDQPDAIAQLAEGLERGDRYQTLLGVTGSGKSLAWDEPVLMRTRRADGRVDVRLRPIGPLVDAALEGGAGVRREVAGTEYGPSSGDVEALSFNPSTGATEWRPITGVSRHAAPPMFRVRTECGREIVVTGDHNFFSLRAGALRLSRTSDLTDEDLLPLPDGFDLPREPRTRFEADEPREARRGSRMPSGFAISDALLTLLGLMLARGHCAKGWVRFAAHESAARAAFLACAAALGMTVDAKQSGQVRIPSRRWGARLARLVGAGNADKHLPKFWPSLSKQQLAVLLRAFAEGEGGMEGGDVRMTTTSPRLVSELGYAFFAFGLWAHLGRGVRPASGHRAGTECRTITLSGPAAAEFAAAIGFMSERKNQALAAALRERAARRPNHLPQHQLVGAGAPFEGAGDRGDALLEDAGPLLRARWTAVRSVEPVDYAHPSVYDLTVAGNETFLAGRGGVFVHNTFTIANVIARAQKPTLVISHNKTLAAQLYGEFKQFFPDNAVGYFISYYDYYQPEAYVPQTNTYIAKDASINDDIDRLRLQATSMLLERDDVIIVASVSCIYGLGAPEDWRGMRLDAAAGARATRKEILDKLVSIQYTRNDVEVGRGNFRVRGDVIEVHPAYEDVIVRIELDDDIVARLSAVDPVTGTVKRRMDRLALYPAKHFVTPEPRLMAALGAIRTELDQRLEQFKREGKLLEAQRLKQRTEYDLEMLGTIGTCPGVENYSRHLSGRKAGDRPGCLIDYFPEGFLLVIDESHVTVPQIGGMYEGDRVRKQTLVDFGFRLPSALDNRPLRFDEFEALTGPTLYVSATPANYEITKSHGVMVEQIIRPTGLIDPEIVVKPITGQVDDLLAETRERVASHERVLVTTLTKRMAEDLTDYLHEMGVRVRYLHSDIDALERVEILRSLRLADFDVLVGINLLREGLDLPEVSLVAVLDADKEGFLRSERSLIQTAGRAARNVNGKVIFYADVMTDSMQRAIDETTRRRAKQLEYNIAHRITPRSVEKSVSEVMLATSVADAIGAEKEGEVRAFLDSVEHGGPEALIAQLEAEMLAAAKQLEFERAGSLRDRIEEIRSLASAAAVYGVGDGSPTGSVRRKVPGAARERAPEPRRVKRRFGRDA